MARLLSIAVLAALAVSLEAGCATKKYVRNRVAERVTPLENRTGELEETSRRNTQQIGELRTGIDDVRIRAEKAQGTADRAASSADQANSRVTGVERDVEDLRANLDKYAIKTTSMVFFKPGSAKLTPEAMAQLDQFASQITDHRGFVLEIVGYGDTIRATEYNESLAQLRAEAVQRYLADRDNVPLMRMFAIGFGAARPTIAQASDSGNGTPTGLGAGSPGLPRRVEIRLLTNEAGLRRPAARTSTTGAASQNP